MGRFRMWVSALCAVGVLAGLVIAAPASAQVFSNPAAIAIPAAPNTQGPGNPYPSAITVAGMTGTVSSVAVTVTGLRHTFPGDVDLLLVGPSGQNVVLLADTGGSTDITNVNLTFNQSAATLVPSPIVTGTFRPTNNGAFTGPAPAPPGPYGASLAIFNGTAPNGTWNLFAFDDAGGDTGAIDAGWSMDIITNGPTLTSFAPTSGAAGTQVVLTGTNLTGATAVLFAGTAATAFTVNSPTQITATVPPGAASGPISVTTPNGTATTTASFQTTPPPTITALAPTSGAVGTPVTITGTNLTGATSVTFAGTPAASVTVASPTQINTTVPAGAGAGPVSVVTPGGTAASTAPFIVSHARRISLSLSRTRARGSVTALDGFGKCTQGVAVRVQRRTRRGGFATVASGLTSPTGTYSLAGVRAKGRYRAVASAATLSSGDTCGAATSRQARRR